jgi:hypothetical protein
MMAAEDFRDMTAGCPSLWEQLQQRLQLMVVLLFFTLFVLCMLVVLLEEASYKAQIVIKGLLLYAAAVWVVVQQAEGGNPDDADNVRGSWFSNPGAGNTSDATRSGVGKYIVSAQLDKPLAGGSSSHGGSTAGGGTGSADAGAPAAPKVPAAKKQKVSQQPMMNFDAW